MNKTWILIKREFKTKVMTRAFIISTVVTPLLVLGFAFGPVLLMKYAGENPVILGYVDYSGKFGDRMEALFPDTLKNGQPRFHLVSIPPEVFEQRRESYREDLQEGKLDVVILIPADVDQSREITYLSKSVSDIELIQLIRSRIADHLNRQRLQAAGVAPELIEELTRSVEVKTVKVTKEGEKEKGVGEEFGTVFVFLFILYFTLVFYGVAIMQGVLE
ncbi:MAG: ABC transporter permease, partial [Calditrichaeota bacterium]